MDGWIKLHRKMAHSDSTFRKLTPEQMLVVIYLLLHANHKDGEWTDTRRGLVVPVKRGQIVTSLNTIVGWFSTSLITMQKVRYALEKLEELRFLTKQSTNCYTLITIVNYGVYQEFAEPSNKANDKETTKRQQSDRFVSNNKQEEVTNTKNVKKEKKKPYSEYVTLTETEYRSLCEKFGLAETLEMIEILNHYKGATGKPYKSDFSAIHAWVEKEWRQRKVQDAKHGGRAQGMAPATQGPEQSITKGRTGWIRPGVSV